MSTETSNLQESSAYFPLHMLDELVIIEIMKRMSIYDRMSFSQTCKSYYRLFNSSPSLHKDKIITINAKHYDAICDQFTYSHKNKDINHVILPNIALYVSNRYYEWELREEFWAKYGPNVLKLMIVHCGVQGPSINEFVVKVLSFCINLEELKISEGINAQFCINQVNVLSTIKYYNLITLVVPGVSDYALNHFLSNAPKLQSVTCGMPDDGEEISLPNPLPQCIPLANLNQKKITNNNLLLVLSIRKEQIKLLDVDIGFDNSCSNIDVIKAIFKIQNLKLEKLPLLFESFRFFYENSMYEKDHLKKVFKRIKNVFGENLLDLLVSGLKGEIDWTGCNKFSNLRRNSLILNDSRADIEGALMDLKYLKNLKALNLKWRGFGYSPSPEAYFRLQEFAHLRSLHLNEADLSNFESFLNAATFNLIELKLDYCKNITSINCNMRALGKNQKSLRSLEFWKCEFQNEEDEIYTRTLAWQSAIDPNEADSSDPPFDRSIDIASSCLVSGNDNDEEMDDNITADLSGLNLLQNLQSFKFRETEVHNFSFLEDLASNELTELELSKVVLTDKILSSISVNCPAITKLTLVDCKFAPAAAIRHLCNLKRLRNIELQLCRGVSQAAIDLIASSCPVKKFEYF